MAYFFIKQGDTGSPVTMTMEKNGNLTHYIIGITLSTSTRKRDSYLRITGSNTVLKDVETLEKVLHSEEEEIIESSTSSEEVITYKLNKRPKY